MPSPLYTDNQAPRSKPESAHSGLWFERFFNRYDASWKLENEVKQAWINTVTQKTCGETLQLETYTQRQTLLVMQLNGNSQRYMSDWNFVTGMGNPHPVENGFSWHPTLAVPYLSGASVKGLVRAWVEMNDERLDQDELKQRLLRWFGTEKKEDIPEQSGDFIFFDALPDQPVQLACDIMTPHMGKWYSDGDKASPTKPETLPADWHEPIPIPFLVVKNTRLIFHIAPRQRNDSGELKELFKALTNALDSLGAGAKTAAGYGYFSEDTSFADDLEREKEKSRIKIENQQRRASLSPFEQDLEDFLKPFQESEHSTRLLSELKAGRWQGEEAKIVAQKIKIMMEGAKKWLPEFTGTNKKKVQLKERSLFVQGYLED